MNVPRYSRRRSLAPVASLGLLALAMGASAQSGGAFEIRRSTIDGGGGRSAGGAFEATGTLGQPDAGVSSGGTFELRGGLWAGPVAAAGADPVFADGFE